MKRKFFVTLLTLLGLVGVAQASESLFFSKEEVAQKIVTISSVEDTLARQKIEWCTVERQGTEAIATFCGRANDLVRIDLKRFREGISMIPRKDFNEILQQKVDEVDMFAFAFGPKSERVTKE